MNGAFATYFGITRYRFAKEIGVPAQRIGELVAGKRDSGRATMAKRNTAESN